MLRALPLNSEVQLLRERAEAILWIKTQMAQFGLHLADLQAAGCWVSSPIEAVQVGHIRFRDAQGHTWDGEGELPDWLRRAVNAGQTIEHFRAAS